MEKVHELRTSVVVSKAANGGRVKTGQQVKPGTWFFHPSLFWSGKYRPVGAAALLRRNLLIYGLCGVIAPFIGIKLIDVLRRIKQWFDGLMKRSFPKGILFAYLFFSLLRVPFVS